MYIFEGAFHTTWFFIEKKKPYATSKNDEKFGRTKHFYPPQCENMNSSEFSYSQNFQKLEVIWYGMV